MHERIGLPIIALNEAKALHRVEELDGARRLLAGQLTCRTGTAGACATARAARTRRVTIARRTAVSDGERLALDLEIGRRDTAAAIDQGEAERLTLGQTGQAGLLDRGDVHEHILAAIIANDEAEALLAVEEFDDARALADNLGGHAAATAACAATTETATAAAAETAAAAATAAEAIATTAEAITAATETIAATAEAVTTAKAAAAAEIVAAETVALVAATPTAIPAASFIETHALFVFPARPHRHINTPALDEKRGCSDAKPIAPPSRCSVNPLRLRINSSEMRHGSLAPPRVRRQSHTMSILTLVSDPAAWAALATLIVMEVVLGIDNLIFISILSNKLPEDQRVRVRRVGIGLALILRLGLLSTIAWIASMIVPVFDLGLTGGLDTHGEPSFETSFSVRDLILIAGGIFLLWKATKEIHHSMDPDESGATLDKKGRAAMSFWSAIVQILLLDMVFSIDSILTAIGMTDELPIMIVAVVVAVGVMMFAADPLANFIARNPTVVMLALGFLLMIGVVLIADGFGVHVPKGYIYCAMAFSAGVETLNIVSRKARERKKAAGGGH
ncbi:MAG: integral rane TerC family protein [Sphingomonas bacterium]|nr:integral rane TerC family protein [Sphingomonas bacterium]